MARKKKGGTVPSDTASVKGFFRINITNPDGTLHGDSGWIENAITNLGYQDFLCRLLGNTTGSQQVKGISIGSGSEPGAADTTLDGEISTAKRLSPTVTVSSDSKQVEFKATFESSNNFLSASSSLKNIGLFNTTGAVGTLFSGKTYTTSTCDTNQNVQVTYKISFS